MNSSILKIAEDYSGDLHSVQNASWVFCWYQHLTWRNWCWFSFKPRIPLAWIPLQIKEEEKIIDEIVSGGKRNWYAARQSQTKYSRNHVAGGIVEVLVCIPCASASYPAVLEALNDRAVLLQPPLLRPSCYSSSLYSNKCLVCHSSLLQRIRFILPLSYTPSLFMPSSLLAHSSSLTQSHVRRRSGSLEYK